VVRRCADRCQQRCFNAWRRLTEERTTLWPPVPALRVTCAAMYAKTPVWSSDTHR